MPSPPAIPSAIPCNPAVSNYRPATVLFADMIGFTKFCAENNPAKVVEVLRNVLCLMSEQVLSHGGTVEKYLGDGLMAVFGGSQHDATKAVHCAIAMHEAVAKWNGARGCQDDEAIQIAVGINTGRVIIGAIGSDRRQEMAVLGDTVNIASRVEGKCRCLDAAILLTAQVMDKIEQEGQGEQLSFANFGFQELRGRAGYVHLYGVPRSQIIGSSAVLSHRLRKGLPAHGQPST